jgi:hypothetical protein
MKKINVIITGSTGMVGEGVLHECIQNPWVENILLINRTSCGVKNPKIKELIHANFFDISAIEAQLIGYDACFFCLGVSSIGMNEVNYFKMTHTLTLHIAQTLSKLNTGMTFIYVSGKATDSSEKGKSMWARVKGKTENDLMKLPFKQVFAFRPGYIQPIKGLKHTHGFYNYIQWMYPLILRHFPNMACTLEQLGKAMINATCIGYTSNIIESKDIISLSEKIIE